MKHEIQAISVRKLDGDGTLKAFVDIRMDSVIVIQGCCVMENKKGLFVAMPRKVNRDGQWRDMVIVLDESLKEQIEKVILDAYNESIS